MDSDLEGKEIFFTGEYHGTEDNVKLEMKFLQYFKEKTDFTYYLCEDSYSGAYFLNKYLDTGNEKILEDIYEPLRGTFAYNKGSYNHWKEVYEYNKQLPENKKIKIIGIDIEHQIINSYRFFIDVLFDKEVPIEIIKIIEELKDNWIELQTSNILNTQAFSEKLKEDIIKKEEIYKEFLGGDFLGFNLVNDNIINHHEAYGEMNSNPENWNNVRDKMMYDNFMQIYEEIPSGKFYGQLGLDHAFQSEDENAKWFAAYLNEEGSIFKDKILTVAYLYDNCKFMKQSGVGYKRESTIGNNSILKIFNDLSQSNLNLYNLDKKNLTFKSLLNGENMDIPIKNVFQYIVVINDSKAEKRLKN